KLHANQRTEDANRQTEQDGERHSSALVLRRENEKHKHHRHAKDRTLRAAGFLLLVRDTCPFVSVPLRQVIRREVFHDLQRLAGRDAGRVGAVDFRGAEHVVALQDVRTGHHADAAYRRERHHGTVVGANVDIFDALRRLTEVLLRLQHNFISSAKEIEVVHLKATKVDLQAAKDVIDRNIERADLVAIDVQFDLWNRGAVGGVDAGELRLL